jgi:hypothetical protein
VEARKYSETERVQQFKYKKGMPTAHPRFSFLKSAVHNATLLDPRNHSAMECTLPIANETGIKHAPEGQFNLSKAEGAAHSTPQDQGWIVKQP